LTAGVDEGIRVEPHSLEKGRGAFLWRAQQGSAIANACDHDPGHDGGHHERRWFVGCPASPARQQRPRVLDIGAHGTLHESPGHKGNDQHHAERVDPGRALKKDIVDDERILKEGEVALHAVLALSVGIQKQYWATISSNLIDDKFKSIVAINVIVTYMFRLLF